MRAYHQAARRYRAAPQPLCPECVERRFFFSGARMAASEKQPFDKLRADG